MKSIRIFAVMLLTAGLFIQANPASAYVGKTNMIGLNPLGLLVNMYSGHYGKIIKDGGAEINVPFFYWSPIDEMTFLGGGVKYRIYKDGNGKGVYYGGGIEFMSYSWDIETVNANWETDTETISGITFDPMGEVGYRWSWDNGWTVAPSLTLGYYTGTIEDSYGNESDYGSSGLSWGLTIGLAYMF